VCLLCISCGTYVPLGSLLNSKGLRGQSVVTWLALASQQQTWKVPWLLAVGSWYWSDFNMDNCLYHIKSKERTAVGWHSRLYQALKCQSFVKLHLSTLRRRNRRLKDSWLYKLIDEFEYSFKLSREWVRLSCWGLWSLGCWSALGVQY